MRRWKLSRAFWTAYMRLVVNKYVQNYRLARPPRQRERTIHFIDRPALSFSCGVEARNPHFCWGGQSTLAREFTLFLLLSLLLVLGADVPLRLTAPLKPKGCPNCKDYRQKTKKATDESTAPGWEATRGGICSCIIVVGSVLFLGIPRRNGFVVFGGKDIPKGSVCPGFRRRSSCTAGRAIRAYHIS